MPVLTEQSGTVLNDPEQDPRTRVRAVCGKPAQDDPKVSALAALAFAVLKENIHRYTTDGAEFRAVVKDRAGAAGMAYNGASITKALNAAEARLKREAAA